MKNILITGGAGFIGSNFVELMVEKYNEKYNIIVFDKLTYAGNLNNLNKVKDKITFIKGDICDFSLVEKTIEKFKIDTIINFAAETHVDNSIKDSLVFTRTNVMGTHTLLEVARKVWGEGSSNKFVHISTDEVFGTLGDNGYFTEESEIKPNNPYSASKAASDLIALAYSKTYKMNICITNCSNNYGPHQYHEKLIPHMISLAMQNKPLTVYGNGLNIRDWIYVKDHCEAIDTVLHNGKKGERYNIGGNNEKTNIEIVKLILKKLKKPESLISYVEDRKGHDYRYSMDFSKLNTEFGWKPKTAFEDGIEKTINWYTSHPDYL